MRKIYLCLFLLLFLISCKETGSNSIVPTPLTDSAKIEKFRSFKFGMFIHWNPSSVAGVEISWGRYGSRKADSLSTWQPDSLPSEIYDSLYKQFNPTKFKAENFVDLLKQAGMRYMVFTTKHHDGFSNYFTQFSDYRIGSESSPFKRDICAELASACHSANIPIGWYYSQKDWHQPDYFTANHQKYIDFMHNQLNELTCNYGKIDFLWFDGNNDPKAWNTPRMFELLRRNQPDIFINDRGGLPGDYDTMEEVLWHDNFERPWETCQPFMDEKWSWHKNGNVIPLQVCLELINRIAGGDGNLLLGVAPNAEGEIDDKQTQRLVEIGQWLNVYGESIYNTRGGPYYNSGWGSSTRNNKYIYLHILNFGGNEYIDIPVIPFIIRNVSVLHGSNLTFNQNTDRIRIMCPKENMTQYVTIIKIEIDGNPMKIPAIKW